MINGTLIVQMFNFYIGYLLLKYGILKPALEYIQEREEHIRQLNYEIVHLRSQIAMHEEAVKKLWKECSGRIARQIPSPSKSCSQKTFENPFNQSLLVSLHEKEKEDCIMEFVKKVEDVLFDEHVS